MQAGTSTSGGKPHRLASSEFPTAVRDLASQWWSARKVLFRFERGFGLRSVATWRDSTRTCLSSGPLPMSIVATKVRPPQLRNGLVHRPRLLERLVGPLPKLVLFCAPAGFGKTTLALDWLRQTDRPFAWLSLDASDNEPARFFAHLTASVGVLEPVPTADRGLRRRGAPAPRDEATLAHVLGALSRPGASGTLVLDDYQHIEAVAVHEAVRGLLDGLAPALHLVLLTRVDPPLPLGRLRVAGELLEVRERDLRFTHDETGAFFRLALPAELPQHLVDLLEQRTEGWAAGLRMAALALQGAADPEGVVNSFSGNHHFVMDYLLEEALARQPQRVQHFLMQTSILSRFDAGLCAAVTADPEASRLLDAVEAANLFLVPLDGEHRWFRYHHLFAELLEFRLRRLHPELVDALHARASQWCEAHDDVHEALRHASRIAAPDRFFELLDRRAMEMLTRSELATLERWARYVPEPESLRHPMLLTALAWFRLLTERAPVLEPLLAAADAAVADPPVPYTAARQQEVRSLLAALRAYRLRFQNRPAEAIEASEAVLRRLPDTQRLVRGVLLFNQARAQMQLGEMRPAHPILQRSLAENLGAGTGYLVLASLGHMGAVLLQLEGVQRARESLDAALAMAREKGIEALPACGIVLYQLGRVLYLADDLDRAREVLERAVELGRSGHEPEVLFNALLQLARVDAARGDSESARSRIGLAELIGQAHNANPFDTTLRAERARLALRSGDPEAAGELRGDSDAAATLECTWTPAWEAEAVVTLQLALQSDGVAPVGPLAARLRQEAHARERGVALCEAAIAETLLHPPGEAQRQLLDRALQTAARRGYVRPWLDWGAPVRALLCSALDHGLSVEADAFARLLLGRQTPRARTETLPIPPYLQTPPFALTAREQEVLRHLARGRSNKAIARSMSVSLETIKTHLKHIFAKLGAGNRRDAIERAQAAGLLSAEEPA
jgi:LuxR family transcriptional regulator, maltose regulon positive regulatory protein